VPQKYPKPPIVEAILHVRYATAFGTNELERIPRLLESEYPKAKPEQDIQLQVEFNPSKPTGTGAKPTIVDKGPRLLSANDQKVVVTRTKQVIFGYHAPYGGWDDFVGSAKFVIDTVRDKLGYKPIQSIGLRYVNRIDIPIRQEGETIITSDYLLSGVSFPETKIAESLRAFQSIVEFGLAHDQLVARLISGTANPALIEHASLLLDIDIIAEHNVPQKETDFWSLVGRMRHAKNEIFESCLTDKARMLFGWKS
jgi:uncharacterized protein (TIGR04255 family)